MHRACLLVALLCTPLSAQLHVPAPAPAPAAQPETPKDALGRSSPRGTVLGFFEIFAYVMTRDRLEFLVVKEGLLLQIMDTVEAAGAHIALQSPLYVGPSTSAPSVEQATFLKSNESTTSLKERR